MSLKTTRDDPLAYPRDPARVAEWLKRNGVFFYQRTDAGQPWRSLAWCPCCGYIIPPMHSRHIWTSYHDAIGALTLCGFCDEVSMHNVQETLKRLLAIIREASDDSAAQETST